MLAEGNVNVGSYFFCFFTVRIIYSFNLIFGFIGKQTTFLKAKKLRFRLSVEKVKHSGKILFSHILEILLEVFMEDLFSLFYEQES